MKSRHTFFKVIEETQMIWTLDMSGQLMETMRTSEDHPGTLKLAKKRLKNCQKKNQGYFERKQQSFTTTLHSIFLF